MTDVKLVEVLYPLLSEAALKEVREHCEALEAMGHTKRDRRLAIGLRFLLENHDRRKTALDGLSR